MRMRGSAIRSVRSKCQSQWKMPNFVSHRPKNSVEIDSVVMNLRMREKNAFSCGFLVNLSIYLSVYLSIPFYVGATCHIFEQLRRFMAQTTYFRNHWCLLGSQWYTLTFSGSKSPKNIFGAWIGVFKPNTQIIKTSTLSKVLCRFQPNFAQWFRPQSSLRGWSQCAYNKSNMADGRRLKKSKNRRILAAVRAMSTKFGMMTQLHVCAVVYLFHAFSAIFLFLL